jgi:hypothetical protein
MTIWSAQARLRFKTPAHRMPHTAVSPHLKAVSSGFATLRATALQMIGSLRRLDTLPKWDIILIPIGLSFVQTHFREEPGFVGIDCIFL